tara:strand:- start:196 stop:570 length:375 start_codon:yes stop_codon:yes gene_type:complete
MSNSNAKINLLDYINSFSWDKRIVLIIAKEKHSNLINKTDDFFERNSYENESRNLEYVRIVGDDINKYNIPERYNNKYGIWLIGYDGGDKSYSMDASLLESIYGIIDKMPIRQAEVAEQNKKCK